MTSTRRKSLAPITVLIVIAVLINYVDRGNLALAAPLLKSEWNLSASQIGILLSAFFWTYMLCQIPAGWLIDRFDAGTALAVGFVVWTGATAMTGLTWSFSSLFAMRLVLGAGESVVFPASSKIYSECIQEKDRGLANGLVVAALHWGTAIGTLGGGFLMARFGWRLTFVATGLIALAWLPPWLRLKPRPLARKPKQPLQLPALAAIAGLRQFWGASIGHGCSNHLLYFLLTWLPYYLVQERHLSMTSMAGTAALLYALNSVSAIAAGWIADLQIRRGAAVCSARKWSMTAGLLIAIVALMGCVSAGPRDYLVWLAALAVGTGSAGSGVWAMAQTLAGPSLAGRWAGMQNCVANISGVAGPALVGVLVQRTGNFRSAFAVSAVFALAGVVAWVFGVRSSDAAKLLPEQVFTYPGADPIDNG